MLASSVIGLLTLVVAFTNAQDDNKPTQLRLAYAGPNGMTVSWNTASKLDRPTVRYGLNPFLLLQRATSDISVTYPTSTTYNNHVKIDRLLQGQTYYYTVESDDTKYAFQSSPRSGSHQPFEVAVVVDLGSMGDDGLTTHTGKGAANPLKPGETNTIQSVDSSKSEFDFLWHSKSLLA